MAVAMTQLTLRGFDKQLERRLREVAKREGISLNRAALRLLRKGAGLEPSPERAHVVGNALDHLAGSWSESDERELRAAVAAFEEVDEELWR